MKRGKMACGIMWSTVDEDIRNIIDSRLGKYIDVIWINRQEEALNLLENGELKIFVSFPRNWVIEKARNLKLYQLLSAGADRLDLKLAREKGIIIASAKGANAFYVAELAVAHMLALVKRIVYFDSLMKNDVFPPYTRDYQMGTLKNKTVIILGYGNIGREIARLLKPFGARVIGVRRRSGPRSDGVCDEIISIDELDQYIGYADIIVNALPLTRDTHGLLNKDFFSKLKKGSVYLINVGRGPTIDEEALAEALDKNYIAGAGIDVWWLYPPEPGAPSRHGIHKNNKVIATPHRGGSSDLVGYDLAEYIVENIMNFLNGKPLKGVVDYDLGY